MMMATQAAKGGGNTSPYFGTRGAGANGGGRGKGKSGDRECYNCRGKGHIARNCPHPKTLGNSIAPAREAAHEEEGELVARLLAKGATLLSSCSSSFMAEAIALEMAASFVFSKIVLKCITPYTKLARSFATDDGFLWSQTYDLGRPASLWGSGPNECFSFATKPGYHASFNYCFH